MLKIQSLIYGSFLSVLLVVGGASPALANHAAGHSHAGEAETFKGPGIEGAHHTLAVEVNGLVCDFCARALEKVFMKREEVSGIDVNLTTKRIIVGFKEGRDIDDGTITQLITDAGYNVVSINR